MYRNQLNPLDAIIHHHDSLKEIQQHALLLVKLDRTVKALISSVLRPHCRVANYRQSILIVNVDSANWLTLLRYEKSTLLSALRAEILPGLVDIKLSINPTAHKVESSIPALSSIISPAPSRKLSPKSALLLSQFATQCPDGLKNKLHRLIDTTK